MNKLIYPSAERNKDVILAALKTVIEATATGYALEIASGTGQHISYFASYFTKFTWQPTDIEKKHIDSINAYRQEFKSANILPPLIADISKDFKTWNSNLKENSVDLIFNANMIHISPIECTYGLFKTAGTLLRHGGQLVTYGPYSIDGVLTPQSNVDFDLSLKARNSEWGVRDSILLKKLAKDNFMDLITTIDMPSNNKCLVFKKTRGA